MKFYEEQGIEGLQSYKPGPASTCEELKQYVIKKYIELESTRGYQNKILEEVKEKVEEGEFRKSISRGMLQKILRGYRDERERQKEGNLEKRKKEEIEKEEAEAKDEQMAETGVETNHEEDDKQLEFIEEHA